LEQLVFGFLFFVDLSFRGINSFCGSFGNKQKEDDLKKIAKFKKKKKKRVIYEFIFMCVQNLLSAENQILSPEIFVLPSILPSL